jgi:signal transduction histidine kinase
VQISLPQQYMVTAIDVMRIDYRRVLEEAFADDQARFVDTIDAVDRLFDLELAIMLQTYRIDSEDRLRRRERLATIGQIAASIGHDLRNPLGVIESSLFILRRRLSDDPKSQRHIDKIARQVQNCDRIVTDLLDMARNSPPKRRAIDLDALVDDALAGLQVPPLMEIRREIAPSFELQADPGLLQQAVVNLITNAMRALSPNPGTIVIEARPTEDDYVLLTVSDNGPGFDTSILPLAFEPLVSTGAKGIGLGLALVKSVAERHGGWASARNRPEGGAEVTLRLPKNGPSRTEEVRG